MKAVAAGLVLFLATGADAQEMNRLEALRYNPRERTQSGLSALDKGDFGTALEQLETASRLDQANPLTVFNAGTAKLIAGQEGAADRLEEAAAVAPEGLQPAVQYNLGNARLAEQNPAAAVAAYKQVLRLDPAHMEAKFNLEVAQRLLEQQKQQDQQQQQNQDSSEQQNEPQQDQQEEQQDQEPQENPSDEPEEQQGSGGEDEQRQQERPLPDFEDQDDMTAEQAAAILEAVENLEREQRRRQAAERSRRRAKSGKDW